MSATQMNEAVRLTLPEELVLFALDDESGKLVEALGGPASLNLAIAGAMLMELELRGRVDSDSNRLFAVNESPTGVALLDEVLGLIVSEPKQLSSEAWLNRLASNGDAMRAQLISSLVARGILREERKRLLWVLTIRAYPPVSGREEQEVRARILELLEGDDIPEAHDALLVGLLHATGLFVVMLSEAQLQSLRPRIVAVTNLEEISRSLGGSVRRLQEILVASLMAVY